MKRSLPITLGLVAELVRTATFDVLRRRHVAADGLAVDVKRPRLEKLPGLEMWKRVLLVIVAAAARFQRHLEKV